jgi:cell division protein FtsQ
VTIDERIAERRRQVRGERRRGRLRRTITLVVVAVVAVVLVLVERSALVGLEEVQVVGTDRLDPAEVHDAAELRLGTSTLRLRLGEVERRVRELPLVHDVEARRLDPLTVRIEVRERIPALTVRGDGRDVLVDREGVVVDRGRLAQLPEIRLDQRPPGPGAHVADLPALANAHAAWRSLSGPLRAEVVRYDATGPDELTLRLRDGVEVRFGRAERVDEKVRALGAVLDDVGDAEVEVVDVRAPSAPVVVGP